MQVEADRALFFGALLLLGYLCWMGLVSRPLMKLKPKDQAVVLPEVSKAQLDQADRGIRDPFGLGLDFLTPEEAAAKKAKAKKKKVVRLPALKIEGIMGPPGQMLAVINGSLVGEDDHVRGVQVVRIESAKVVLKFRGQVFEKALVVPSLESIGAVTASSGRSRS